MPLRPSLAKLLRTDFSLVISSRDCNAFRDRRRRNQWPLRTSSCHCPHLLSTDAKLTAKLLERNAAVNKHAIALLPASVADRTTHFVVPVAPAAAQDPAQRMQMQPSGRETTCIQIKSAPSHRRDHAPRVSKCSRKWRKCVDKQWLHGTLRIPGQFLYQKQPKMPAKPCNCPTCPT